MGFTIARKSDVYKIAKFWKSVVKKSCEEVAAKKCADAYFDLCPVGEDDSTSFHRLVAFVAILLVCCFLHYLTDEDCGINMINTWFTVGI